MKPPILLVPLVAVFSTALLSASNVSAQTGGDGFLFEPPKLIVNLNGGFARPDADSELFGFVTELLTVQRGDFQGFSAGGSFSVPVSSRLDVTAVTSYSARSTDSEFREWVDNDDRPIEQRTNFARVPVTVGVKYHLLPRGQSVGSFAWIPERYAPYIGTSAGAVWYRFQQTGDFVDFDDLAIFRDHLESTGWAPAVSGFAGLEYSLTPRLALSTEAGYLWSRARLDRDFAEFDRIDLSGFSASAGISIRL